MIFFFFQFSWLKTGCPTSVAPSSSFVDLHHASLDPSARYSINTTNNAVACKPYWTQSEPTCTCPVNSDQELPSATPSNESACSDDSGIQNVSIPHSSTSIIVDIDKIMAKIDQDNRILAELDKTRSTIGESSILIDKLNLFSFKKKKFLKIHRFSSNWNPKSIILVVHLTHWQWCIKRNCGAKYKFHSSIIVPSL